MVEYIRFEERTAARVFAIIIRAEFRQAGIAFFTPSEFSQQLGYMHRPAGYVIAPHRHILHPREVTLTQEVLLVKSGSLRTDFYDDDGTYLGATTLHSGDVILLASGGHGFEMLEPTELIEVKQGPYLGDEDKVYFT